jgi:hypothetical protein
LAYSAIFSAALSTASQRTAKNPAANSTLGVDCGQFFFVCIKVFRFNGQRTFTFAALPNPPPKPAREMATRAILDEPVAYG